MEGVGTRQQIPSQTFFFFFLHAQVKVLCARVPAGACFVRAGRQFGEGLGFQMKTAANLLSELQSLTLPGLLIYPRLPLTGFKRREIAGSFVITRTVPECRR